MLQDLAHPKHHATWRHATMAVLLLASTCVHAADDVANDVDTTSAIARDNADLGAGETATSRAAIRKIIERETARTNLPADIAEAVVFVESGYNSAVVGSVGEVGLMQVRPETAAMLGFRGNSSELAEPDINIHYGVIYLSRAWRLAAGDLCRALMKYRAGHGEETMTARSQVYCNRARNRLLAMNSAALETPIAAVPDVAPTPTAAAPAKAAVTTTKSARDPKVLAQPKDVYARYRQGTAAASRAYWAAQEARVSLIKARIEARWKRVASR
ncbi:lytic transglycosylase domain-containing protein [Bradyrhizobium commune]|uniref:Transglycosylase SLT domain-containing protein n=1 Tax=Bradyrhizobium commune TaxID=83627 RepID=A0A7S9GXT7_9BRAD|nr:transglycosylase SLT domain-containing protein [Bradyrhizobium commune]QPF90210.1 transglycosylase SLT domain-containing protein [Bradyrhizobium commune]